MSSNKISVAGSINTDMVIKSEHLPIPGETILGGEFFMNQGGKGANQAVAAARLGGKVTLVAKTGNDIFGEQSKQLLFSEGINTDFLFTDPENSSGVALITVDSKAENCIVVAPGANSALSEADIDFAHDELVSSDVLVMQLEIPIETVLYTAKLVSSIDKKVILNPAPAISLPAELFSYLYAITPNKTEAEMISGVKINGPDSIKKAAEVILNKGVNTVIITLGSQGAYLYNKEISELIPSYHVKAVDTTAAGDVFNGALAVAISERMDIRQAIVFANKAASISVTRMGAQSSAPYRKEII